MSRTSELYDLQQIDSELDQHHNRLNEIEYLFGDNEELITAEKDVRTRNKELAHAQQDLGSAEIKVKEQRLKIKRTEGNLYGGKISNPKELQDLQEEGLALKRFLVVLEDRQLVCMMAVDEKREISIKTKTKLEAVQNKFNLLHAELIFERDQIAGKIDDLIKRREAVKTIISTDDIKTYEGIRNRRHGVAVSKVKNRACSACGATLTAALNQAARSPNQISHCETCGRILIS